jgi:hypothetical protein
MEADLEERLKRMEGKLDALLARMPKPGLPKVDVSDPNNDPQVRKDPKNWQGDSYAGRQYSECPPDYLEMLGSLLEWMADKKDTDGKSKWAAEDRLNAARAYAHMRAKNIAATTFPKATEEPPF